MKVYYFEKREKPPGSALATWNQKITGPAIIYIRDGKHREMKEVAPGSWVAMRWDMVEVPAFRRSNKRRGHRHRMRLRPLEIGEI